MPREEEVTMEWCNECGKYVETSTIGRACGHGVSCNISTGQTLEPQHEIDLSHGLRCTFCAEKDAEIERLNGQLAAMREALVRLRNIGGVVPAKPGGEPDLRGGQAFREEVPCHQVVEKALATDAGKPQAAEIESLKGRIEALTAVPEYTIDGVPLSLASLCDSIDSKHLEECVEELVVYHCQRANKAEAHAEELDQKLLSHAQTEHPHEYEELVEVLKREAALKERAEKAEARCRELEEDVRLRELSLSGMVAENQRLRQRCGDR
jgi:hypothetical protein